MHAAIYARQSLDKTEGIDRQIARCSQLIQAKGWTVSTVYRDNDVSASKDRSKGTRWADMLADVKAGNESVVVAVDLDRLLRTIRDLATLTESGAKVLTVDGEIDLTSADGEFRATMLAGLARFEVARKGERQKRANVARAAAGKPNPGRRRYGYETDSCTPVAREAAVVRWLFEQVADGRSLRSLFLEMKRTIPATTGTAWTTRRIRDTLNSQHYTGRVIYQGTWTDSAYVTPIVDPDLAARVRTMLAEPSRKTTPGATPKHLASGIAKCGVCGANMVHMATYRCHESASHPSIIERTLDRVIRSAVASAFLFGTPNDFNMESSPAALHSAHAANVAATERIVADREDGLVTAVHARKLLLSLRDERKALESELDRARAQSAAGEILWSLRKDVLSRGRVSLENNAKAKVGILEEFDQLDLEKQREIVRGLLDVVVHPGRSEDRVKITQKVVTSLNDEQEVARTSPVFS